MGLSENSWEIPEKKRVVLYFYRIFRRKIANKAIWKVIRSWYLSSFTTAGWSRPSLAQGFSLFGSYSLRRGLESYSGLSGRMPKLTFVLQNPKRLEKKICCKMQSCRVSTHHITKLSNIGSRLQKYPRVFKSVRVCQSQCPRAHLQSLLQTGFGIGARAIPEQSRSVGDHFDHFDAKLGSFAW